MMRQIKDGLAVAHKLTQREELSTAQPMYARYASVSNDMFYRTTIRGIARLLEKSADDLDRKSVV